MTTPTHAAESGSRRAALARILPFGLYIAFLALGGTLAGIVGMDPRWMYALQIAAVVAALLYFWRDYIELTHLADTPPGSLAGMTGWLVALVGFQIKVEAAALPLIGLGMALRLTGARTQREAVEMGLRTVVRLRQQEDIRRFRGKLQWEADLDTMRADA